MLKYTLLVPALLLTVGVALAQSTASKRLEIADLNRWQEIESVEISADGRYVAYVLEPDQGDPTQVLYDTQTEQTQRWPRGDGGHFAADGGHFAFLLHPAQDSVREMRRRKVKKDQLPGDTLALYDLASRTTLRVADVRRFQLPEKWGGWLLFEQKMPLPDSLTKKSDEKAFRLVLHRLSDQEQFSLDGAMQFTVAEEAPVILVHTEGLAGRQEPGVYRFDGRSPAFVPVRRGKGQYESLTLNRYGDRLAFLANFATEEQRVVDYDLHTWESGQDSTQVRAEDWLPSDWRLSEDANMYFAHNGSRLFFGTAPPPLLPDTSLLEEEIVQVEVWTTQDPRMYTRAENQLNQDRKRSYAAVLDWSNGQMRQIATPDRPEFDAADRGDGRYGLLVHEETYQPRRMYEGWPGYRDLYLYDLQTGRTTPIRKAVAGSPQWSPGGKYLYWYSYPDTTWQLFDVADGTVRTLTDNQLGAFYDEENDVPADPGSYGVAGWMPNDDAIVIYDRYDWWRIDPKAPEQAKRLTNGRNQQQQLRYVRTDPEARYLPTRPLVHLFTEDTRHSGYGRLDLAAGTVTPLREGAYDYSSRVYKARAAEAYVYTRESFREFPDLRYTREWADPDRRISEANPQQAEFRWGNMELFTWTDPQGRQVEGLLLKPDDFDPSQQYPLIVYFYEKSSDGLYEHRAPYAHRSTINYSYYVSRGYVIFNPDVIYREGYPGESAYDAVMSGVTALLDEGYIDRQRVGVQGHSWGGYQIAYLLTKTDLFACAESGAPVVNMFSAYGGIRWGSGLSRQFQYERTQSRIGGTPWEYPLRYLENSPLFFMDKVNTPVLILHNDEDGAVPWYQGIEYFTALRRLDKPAWLLNYNGEPHWPLKYQNRVDFQTRMSQFFDYYLLDGPKPRWMDEGVSPLRKGIDQALETAQEK
jgi:dipeptidyl aminopeptidase/acylaminoacyl peptidase